MKKTLIQALLLSLGLSLIPSIARTQSQEGCYMIGADGQRIDLGRICGQPSSGGNSAAQNFKIPIKRRESGTPVIDVVFNGKQTFEMLLDTGASHTVITPAMAEALSLQPVADTASETGVAFPLGLVESMEAGSIAIGDILVAVSPALELGLLGQDFYGSYDVTIREKFVEFRSR
ncbi:retroviral-like aspartic protease family protein [Lusitaniella coriacea LEGE 07157]|uniref:Retroviral-like aspartic protease family protein n=1 Tax=Lusitaniella coriacea LEGE 07157 TaxID=945747 RepID=A0A8J7JD88_9CYAN|nr:retropepsin-like aspartic protease [Lusitaniella coriacea]MBE9117900.1 retroviral-like aspartic protease family protein [Lusitaniella coriacea LEGE 07157]